MASPIITAAEAVKDMLNAETFSQDFTATREYMLYQRLAKIAGLTVWVVPTEREIIIASRAKDQNKYSIAITVMDKANTTAEIDALQALSEEIYQLFKRGNLTGLENYKLSGTEVPVLYSLDELGVANLYGSVCIIEITDIA